MGPVTDGVAVEVDGAAIAAELEQLRAENPAAAPAATGEPGTDAASLAPVLSPEQKAAQYAPSFRMLVAQGASTFAPNWDLLPAETNGVGDALALVAAHWMPDMELPPKYMCLLAAAVSLWSVAAARRDPETGAFKPLRKPAPEKGSVVQ